tara:strand:- start:327 stop:575 length:249 start_codon:yes stop_codon:yes gene_type:complete
MPKYSIKRITSEIVDLFCGYGKATLRIVGISMLLILFCLILYIFTGLNYQANALSIIQIKSPSKTLIFVFQVYITQWLRLQL